MLFSTLAGDFESPPFHWHCRSILQPWMPGMTNDIRAEANAEMRRRPLKQRRIGPDGELGRPNVPPDRNNPPTGNSMGYDQWRPKRPQIAYSADYGDGGKSWVTPAEKQSADRLHSMFDRAHEFDEWDEFDDALYMSSDREIAAFMDGLPRGTRLDMLEVMGDRGPRVTKILEAGQAQQAAAEEATKAALAELEASAKAGAEAVAKKAVGATDEVADWLTANEKRVGAKLDDLYKRALASDDDLFEELDDLIRASSDREIAGWFRLMDDAEWDELLDMTMADRADDLRLLMKTKPMVKYNPKWQKVGGYDGMNFTVRQVGEATVTHEGRVGFSSFVDEAIDNLNTFFEGKVPIKRDLRVVELDISDNVLSGLQGFMSYQDNTLAVRWGVGKNESWLLKRHARSREVFYHEMTHMFDEQAFASTGTESIKMNVSSRTLAEYRAGVVPTNKLDEAFHDMWRVFDASDYDLFSKFNSGYADVLKNEDLFDEYAYSAHEVFAREFASFIALESGDVAAYEAGALASAKGSTGVLALQITGKKELYEAFRKIAKELTR